MKTINRFLLLGAALALGTTATYAGPSDSAAFALKAAQEARERVAVPTIALAPSGKKGCAAMVVNSNNPKGLPYYANCSSPALRDTAQCKRQCAR